MPGTYSLTAESMPPLGTRKTHATNAGHRSFSTMNTAPQSARHCWRRERGCKRGPRTTRRTCANTMNDNSRKPNGNAGHPSHPEIVKQMPPDIRQVQIQLRSCTRPLAVYLLNHSYSFAHEEVQLGSTIAVNCCFSSQPHRRPRNLPARSGPQLINLNLLLRK